VSTVERIHHAVYEHGVHPGSDLAISDSDAYWQEIHRVKSFVTVSNAFFYYRTDCGRTFLLQSEARSLSSGWVGALCTGACWKHLTQELSAA
jgi:hypothetical protein